MATGLGRDGLHAYSIDTDLMRTVVKELFTGCYRQDHSFACFWLYTYKPCPLYGN